MGAKLRSEMDKSQNNLLNEKLKCTLKFIVSTHIFMLDYKTRLYSLK